MGVDITVDRYSYRVIRSFVETYSFNIEHIKQYYTTIREDVTVYTKPGKWSFYVYRTPKEGIIAQLENAVKLIQQGDRWFVEIGDTRIPLEDAHNYAIVNPNVPYAHPINISRIIATMCKFVDFPFCDKFPRYELCLQIGGYVMCAER